MCGDKGKPTNCGQQSGHWSIVSISSGLVLPHNATPNALDNADLAGLFVVQLTKREGKSAKLLNDLRKSLPRAGPLENVGGGSATVQRRPVLEGLDLARSKTEADLDAPDLSNLGGALTLDTSAWRKDDLLRSFDLVAVEQPAGGILNDMAIVGLRNLLNQAADLSLRGRLLSLGLLLLFFGAGRHKTGGNHEPKEELVGVIGGHEQIGLATGDLVTSTNDNRVADNRSKAVNLRTQLDLDDLTSLQGRGSFLRIGGQGSVRGHIRAGRDGGRVGNA